MSDSQIPATARVPPRSRADSAVGTSSPAGAGQHVDPHPQVQGDLRGEVGAAAEPVDAEPAAWCDAAAAQRAIADDPGTQQGCGVLVVERVRQAVDVRLVGDTRVRIPAVEIPSGELRRAAEVLVTTTAVETAAIGASQPRHTDAVSDPETV